MPDPDTTVDDNLIDDLDKSVDKDVDLPSSLDNLKGKTLDDDTFKQLTDLVTKKVESAADKRVTDARKSWENTLDKRLDSGEFYSREDVDKLITKNNQLLDRKAEARNQFLDTLSEMDIKPVKGNEGYDAFTKAYNEGLEKGDWTSAILRSQAGIRTIGAAAGLVGSGGGNSDDGAAPKALRPIPAQGLAIGPTDKKGKLELTETEKRHAKMRAAIGLK